MIKKVVNAVGADFNSSVMKTNKALMKMGTEIVFI